MPLAVAPVPPCMNRSQGPVRKVGVHSRPRRGRCCQATKQAQLSFTTTIVRSTTSPLAQLHSARSILSILGVFFPYLGIKGVLGAGIELNSHACRWCHQRAIVGLAQLRVRSNDATRC